MIKQQFTLYMENRPGVLASVSKQLADAGVNLEGISVSGTADVGLVQIITSDKETTRSVLEKSRVAFTTQEVAVLSLPNEPGQLARGLVRIAEAGVNVSYIYATACDCDRACGCFVVISAPDLKAVERAWEAS
jgi:hypothetical protein